MERFDSNSLRWLWISLVIFILDFMTKQWITHNMILYHSRKFIPFINVFYTKNYGAIFSLLSNENGWQYWFFIIAGISIILLLLIIMSINDTDNHLSNISYALIIGGALGNLLDRMYHGFVVDFIDFYIKNWHFATFNIADTSIFIGTAMLFLEKYLKYRFY